MNIELSEINFPTSLDITGQHIDISFLSDKQKQFYVDLLREIVLIYKNKQKSRVVIGFVGPSGSGKSTVVELLKVISKQVSIPFNIETTGIDAYSFPNTYLLSHLENGRSLKDFKGRHDTYNVKKLEQDLLSFAKGEKINLPIYSRVMHNPVENSFQIEDENVLLLIEGLWILSDKSNWDKIATKINYSFFILINKDEAKELTIKRHVAGGRTLEDSVTYYDSVDAVNFEEVMHVKERADKIIPSFSGI